MGAYIEHDLHGGQYLPILLTYARFAPAVPLQNFSVYHTSLSLGPAGTRVWL